MYLSLDLHVTNKSVVMGGPLKRSQVTNTIRVHPLGDDGCFHSMFSFFLFFADKEIFLSLNEYSPEELSQ